MIPTTLTLLALLFFSSPAAAATLFAGPNNVQPGGTLALTYDQINNPTIRDWVGLYQPGAPDTSYIDWIYVNTCTKGGGSTAPTSGHCNFTLSSGLPNGNYELRLLANNVYTRLATSAQILVGPPTVNARFVDYGDGTIVDNQTGLMWEKKNPCPIGTHNPDVHCVNNGYFWSAAQGSSAPDGGLFTDFLARINKVFSTSTDGITVADVCFAGYCDWRIPNIAELRTLFDTRYAPTIDPIFGPTGGYYYWSSSSGGGPFRAWCANFSNGETGPCEKNDPMFFFYARAVRGAR